VKLQAIGYAGLSSLYSFLTSIAKTYQTTSRIETSCRIFHILYNSPGDAPKIASSPEGIWPASNTWFIGSTHVYGTHSTSSVWDSCLESDGTIKSEIKYFSGLLWLHSLISHPVNASRYLGMWLDLTTSHRQTWLFSSTSTLSLNRPPDRTWRRPPGRPRNKWLEQLRNDSTCLIGDL